MTPLEDPVLAKIVLGYDRYCEASSDAAPVSPARAADVAQRRQILLQGQRFELDPAYLALVERVDGMSADGVRIYPIQTRVVTSALGETTTRMGIVEANQEWREVYPAGDHLIRTVIYGLSDSSFFLFNAEAGRFEHRSRRGIERAHFHCPTFAECLYEAFKYALEFETDDEKG